MAGSDTLPDLHAYTLTQLALAHLSLGHDAEAQEIVNQVMALSDTSDFARFVQESRGQTDGSLMALCRQMRLNAQAVMETDISQYVNRAVIYGAPDTGTQPYLPFLCDLGLIAEQRLINTSLLADLNPPLLMSDLGLDFSFAQEINLDDDPENEWFGILEPTSPSFIIFDAVDGWWRIERPLNNIFYPLHELYWVQKDLTGDDFVETIIVLKGNSGEDFLYQLEVLQSSGTTFESIAWKIFTEEDMPSLDEITSSTFDLDGPPNWRLLETFPTEDGYLKDYVSELQTAVLAQTDPTIPTQITDLLDYLPTDDPEARPYREHLTYLLGYHYELSGDAETAVSTYLSLIQLAATSPWAWLAWARLEPVTSGDN